MPNEMELWESFKQKGDKAAAKELYDSMQPLIKGYLNTWARSGVPEKAIESYSRQLFMKALEDYDPTRGAQLGTHVRNNLNWRMNRFVNKYQNVARINEANKSKINLFKRTKEFLEVSLGREPSQRELAEELKWPEAHVEAMEKSLRRDLSGSELDASGVEAISQKDPRLQESMRLLYFEASPEEQLVMEYSWGWNGKPKLSSADIARRTNLNQTKVSRIRDRLTKRFREIHGGDI